VLAPDRIVAGQYQVMRLLGEGASGRVWLVRDLKERGNRWALKELTPGGSELSPRESRELVAKEIRFLRSLKHPGLPKLVDVIEENGIEYVVMERIEGFTLEQVCANQGGRLKPPDVVNWGTQAARILNYLHSRTPAVVFRDVKPSNLMLDADGAIRLIDLGIARTFNPTRPGDTHCIGTPGYCPPEQYQGRTSPATDVYATGATMFNLLSGEDPEKCKFKFPLVSTLVPEVSEAVDAVISRCLLTNPADRYQNGGELVEALRGILAVKRVPGGLLRLLKRFRV
jgi:serine/threonine-protein kinase